MSISKKTVYKIVAQVAVLGGLGAVAILNQNHDAAATSCSGKSVDVSAPGTNLNSLVDKAEEGTCFVLKSSSESFSFGDVRPKNNMKFLGETRGDVVVKGDGFKTAFYGNASGVEIRNMTLMGFGFGETSQSTSEIPRGAIHGADSSLKSSAENPSSEPTSSKLSSNQATSDSSQATSKSNSNANPQENSSAQKWTIDGVEIHQNAGLGIRLGNEFAIRNSYIHDNVSGGISGISINGLLIEGNTISQNGSTSSDTGNGIDDSQSGGIRLSQSTSKTTRLKVRNNSIVGNKTFGLWFEDSSRGIDVTNNKFESHPSSAIVIEGSSDVMISGNVLTNNSAATSSMTQDSATGGLLVSESQEVNIENNSISGSRSAITIKQRTSAIHAPVELMQVGEQTTTSNDSNATTETVSANKVTISDIVVKNNSIFNTLDIGIGGHPSATKSLAGDAQIRFECNKYNNAGSVSFYWAEGEIQDFIQWNAEGRDIEIGCPIANFSLPIVPDDPGASTPPNSNPSTTRRGPELTIPTFTEGSTTSTSSTSLITTSTSSTTTTSTTSTTPARHSTVIISARGRRGNERLQLRINGVVVKEWINVPTTFTNYTFVADSYLRIGEISLYYNNNRRPSQNPRGMEIEYVSLDGEHYEVEVLPLNP